jgi:hypothetical protein
MPLLSVQWINSWWWAEELSETCRVSCQNKFVKLVHLVGFIIKKILLNVSMHLHHLQGILSFCFALLIIPAYGKHHHRDYTCHTVQTVYTATKLTPSVYCNYNSWQLTAFYWLYFIIKCNCHVNAVIYWYNWVYDFNYFYNFSRVEE